MLSQFMLENLIFKVSFYANIYIFSIYFNIQ